MFSLDGVFERLAVRIAKRFRPYNQRLASGMILIELNSSGLRAVVEAAGAIVGHAIEVGDGCYEIDGRRFEVMETAFLAAMAKESGE